MDYTEWLKNKMLAKSNVNNSENTINVVWFIVDGRNGPEIKGPLPLTKIPEIDRAVIDMGGRLFDDLLGYFLVVELTITEVDIDDADPALIEDLLLEARKHLEGEGDLQNYTEKQAIMTHYFGWGGEMGFEQALNDDNKLELSWNDEQRDRLVLSQLSEFANLGGLDFPSKEEMN